MASYYLNEAVFDLTDLPFVDKTIHGLESKLPGDKTLGVFVHRRALQSGQTLRSVVDENVALNVKRLSAYAVLEEVPATVGGVPGLLLRTRWRSARETYHQLQAHVVFDGKHIILAVSGPEEARAACDETFGCVLDTISWRTE